MLLGQTALAERRLAEPYNPDDQDTVADETRRRGELVAEALRSEDPEAAQSVLRQWRDATVANLKLFCPRHRRVLNQ
ncbi:MAG: hypothetical protein ACTHN0_16340 [Aquihabitans sp.]